MDRFFTMMGAMSAALAVGAGAFGAHALEARLDPDLLAVFETAARYQMYHALALLAVAVAVRQWPGTAARVSGWAFIAGTVVFSGSLYVLALANLRWLGAITPIGGVAFLAGWIALAMAAGRASGRP
jgi:uncharacterized membrane protein YgdD (TMEM256/DUF423 family)